jgi:polar amino acid transport system substrate-binding protein
MDNGIPLSRLDRSPSSSMNLEKFKNGRFDLLPYSETGIFTALKSQGMNPQDYRVVFTLSEKHIYYAFHKETPDATVLKFQQALDQLRRNGSLDRILKKYAVIPLKSATGP